DDSAAVKFVEESPSPGPAVNSTSPVVPRTTTKPPLVSQTLPVSSLRPTQRPTQRPTRKPIATRTTERTTPKPGRTIISTATPTPSRPTSSPSTREQLLRQYCIERGID